MISSLIQAFSKAGVRLSVLRIGPQDPFKTSDDMSVLSSGRQSRICPKEMLKASVDSKEILQELQTLEISNIIVPESEQPKMALAIKKIIQAIKKTFESVI